MSKNKIILWGQPIVQDKDIKQTTFVNNIFVDSRNSMISISLEKCGTTEVNVIRISMEQAQDIGFINFGKLADYIK